MIDEARLKEIAEYAANDKWPYLFLRVDFTPAEVEEMARELLALRQRWVPVSAKLPEKCEAVLAFVSGPEIDSSQVAAYFSEPSGEWRTEWWGEKIEGDDKYPDKVTHWMPLPAPPVASSGGGE